MAVADGGSPVTAARILVVEDEAHLAEGIRFNLELEGYQVEVIADGLAAAERLAPAVGSTADPPPDLVLLDVMLPGLDGFRIVERMRRAGNYTPVLMLTAKGLPEDVVQGLEVGADDYLPKPFDLPVLLARVKGLIRRRDWTRGRPDALEGARIGESEVDFHAFEIRRGGETVRLTLLEATLLKLLVQRRGQVVTKGEILEKVWNLDPETETRAVDNFVMRLRRHLNDDPRSPRHLETVRGAGYRLTAE
jgi:DNA-binding response OmpR family regulator